MQLGGTEIVIATRNAGKVKEFVPMFQELGLTVRSLLDFPELPDVVEDGDTFAANALIKARTIAAKLGVPTLADDSGLTVDRLGGAPGVYSARYAGVHGDDAANNRKLLSELGPPSAGQGLSPARFICAIALAAPDGSVIAQSEGFCEGVIIAESRGGHGFGYDPLFYIPELGKTMAELTLQEKNAISHRGKAIRQLEGTIKRLH